MELKLAVTKIRMNEFGRNEEKENLQLLAHLADNRSKQIDVVLIIVIFSLCINHK